MIPSLLRKRPSGPGWECRAKGHILTTQRLVLRAPKASDAEAIRATIDEECAYWEGLPTTEGELDELAKRWSAKGLHKRPYAEWLLICDRSSGEIVGRLHVTSDSENHALCEIGCSLKEGWRGRGLGSEALAGIISVLPHLGFEEAIAGTRADNEKAIKLFTKFGFARFKNEPHELPNGYVVPSVWMTFDIPNSSRSRCDLR